MITNEFSLIGRVARDVKTTAFKGKDGANMKVIETSIATGSNNSTKFIPIKTFAAADVRPGKKMSKAGYIEGVLKKGNMVAVKGFLDVDQWEKDGQKIYKLVAIAEDVELLSVPAGAKAEGQAAAPAAQPTQAPAQAAPAPAAPAQPEVPEGFLVIPTGADEELPF